MIRYYFLSFFLVCCTIFCPQISIADSVNNSQFSLDNHVKQAMLRYHVPAASIAVINHNRIVLVRAYKNPNYSKLKVSLNSKFQAASISKAVTAAAVLRLVAQNKLNLDQNVNNYLTSWKIPVNKFTRKQRITIRNILDMTSGLSVFGFAGYPVGAELPSLLQMLEGQPPANSEPVIATFIPGTKYFYSSGGFLVLQQLIQDVTHDNFAIIMNKLVLRPLKMHNSLYTKSLHKRYWVNVVPGFDSRNAMIVGGWRNHPELAAGGLWTTPKDLAKFMLAIMQSYQGKAKKFLPQKITKHMLTRQPNTLYGLGLMVNGKGKNLNFSKIGRNFGYVSMISAFPNAGQGAVVMINSNNNLDAVKGIMYAIVTKYKWPVIKTDSTDQDEETEFILSALSQMGFNDTQLTSTQQKIIKQIQKAAKKNPYSERAKQEAKIEENPFAISLYNPNYVLPFYYTARPAYTIYGNTTPEQQKLQHHEFKAQFSFKVPVWMRMFRSKFSLYLTYTQKFYWQVYARSAYFRESNYEPEVFVEYPLFNWNTWRAGIMHQSNGRGGNMERSWNRFYVEGIFSLRHWMLSFKPWALIANKSTRIYNRDIAHYLGHGRLVIAYKYNNLVFSLMTRNNLESGFSRGAIEAAVSFPIFKRLHGYIQYFNGYGQSLIEYNHRTSAVGVGLILNNWI